MRQAILAIANHLLGRTSSVSRILRGLMAWLVVLQLIGGMGMARAMAGAPETDSRYDAASLLAQSDVALDDFAILGPVGNDDSGDDPIHGTSVAVAPPDRPSVLVEGQIAFGLCRSAVTRAIHHTGPPALS